MPVIRFRRGNAVQAADNNQVLASGEPGWEEDTKTLKVGDGVTPWTDLEPIGADVGNITPEEIGAAPAIHNHDGSYAPVNHNHSGTYSPVGHNHDSAYAPVNHNHSGTYSPVGHNHDGTYAPASHNHDATYVKSTQVRDIVSLTQAAYDALGTKVATTLYVIVG